MRVVNRALLGTALLLTAACAEESVGPGTTGTIALSTTAPAATVARGASATFPLAVTRGNGYTGAVTLSAESVPAGVTATFAPASLSGSATTSVLTMDVSAAAVVGTYSVGVRASGTGVADQVAVVSLTVPAPAITLVAGAPQATMIQGTALTVPVTITRTNGFGGAVDLTITGLPGGLAGTFAPASISAGATTSTLTLTALNTATVGTVNVTVSANGSGVTQQNATFALTITPGEQPAFAITATPAALSVTAGQTVQSAIAISRVGGFSEAVSFAVSGAPAGMTASVTPASTTTNGASLSLATIGSIIPGTYNLTLRANSASLPERTVSIAVTVNEAPGLVLALSPAALSMPQTQSRQTAVTVTRTGGLTGNVALALEGAPTGVTGVFAPSPATGTASTLTVTAGATTTPGTYALVVRGTGTGNVSTVAALSLVVLPVSYTLAATPSSLTMPPGTTSTSTIALARDAGFEGTVALSMQDVPNGISVSFTPAAVTGNTAAGNSATLTVTSNSGTLIGAYTTTIVGRSADRSDQTLPFTINIVPPVAGAGNIVWKFCDPARVPRVFAYRNGTSGQWIASQPNMSGEIVATFSASVGSVAYLYTEGVVSRTDVYSGTTEELQQLATLECITRPAATKSYSVFVSGINGLDQVALSVGSAVTAATVGQPIAQLTGVQAGPQDLFATRFETTTSGGITRSPNRMLLRRDVDSPDGTMLTPVEMAGAESFVPASSTLTIDNANGQPVAVGGLLVRSGGPTISTYAETPAAGVVRQYFGLPTPTLLAAELQGLVATAGSSATGSFRTVLSYFRSLADRSIAFGGELAAPTLTSSNISGLTLPRARGPITGEYGASFTALFTQNNLAVSVFATRGYFGAAATEYTLDAPDLTSVAGYDNQFSLGQGSPTVVSVTASGGSSALGAAPVNGTVVRSATRTTTRSF